jgi:hypothetical protein
MTQLHIKIKDNKKAAIVLNFLRELPFVNVVEIEDMVEKTAKKTTHKGKGSLADLFGLWENRNITLNDIRNKAWNKT